MDLQFGNCREDLIVWKDRELLDSWLQLESDTSESLGSSHNCFVKEMNLSREESEFEGRGLQNAIKREISLNEGGFSSVDYDDGSTEASLYGTTFHCSRPDYQPDFLPEMHQIDEIFLNSLLDEDPFGLEDLYWPVCVFPKFKGSKIPPKNVWTDTMVDSQGNLSDQSSSDTPNYLKAHGFPSSVPPHTGQRPTCPMKKKTEVEDMISSEPRSHFKLDKCIKEEEEESTLEESVLQDLEVVITKLTQNTRICFRDALYRLSKRSEQQHMSSQIQNEEITIGRPYLSAIHNQTSWTTERPKETETNTIDRTVANLMFNELKFASPDLSSKASTTFSDEDISTTGSCEKTLNQPWKFHCLQPLTLCGDAEVPTFDMEE